MNIKSTEEKELIEIDYWRTSESENPTTFSLENLFNKMSEAKIFSELTDPYKSIFSQASIILELGAGQGWSSCIIKKQFDKKLITTDISSYAIESTKYWEDIFKVKLDQTLSCKAHDVPLPDESADLIFCFAAAHHFVEHEKAILEVKRLLKPGGKCIYLYEPSCRRIWYKLAYKRVNRKRPHVPEDVLVIQDMKRYARQAGMDIKVDFCPSTTHRGPKETLYYMALKAFPFLMDMLPCTCNYIFEKPGNKDFEVPHTRRPCRGAFICFLCQ